MIVALKLQAGVWAAPDGAGVPAIATTAEKTMTATPRARRFMAASPFELSNYRYEASRITTVPGH